jgi:transposase
LVATSVNVALRQRSSRPCADAGCSDNGTKWVYVNRNLVERLWNRLKEWRAVATRYEKTARSFTGVLCLAAAFDWIKP